MKFDHRSSLSLLILLAVTALSPSFLRAADRPDLVANPFFEVSQSNESSLNDAIRYLPRLGRGYEDALPELSALQEHLLVHERKMRGEGLPESHRRQFAANYQAIVTAIVDDRITMAYGRELLDVHRQLLDKAYAWQRRLNPDPHYGEVIILGLEEIRDELVNNAEPLAVVPECVRTPIIKGHLLWIEELIHSSCHCRALNAGELNRLRIKAARLERFEFAYKRNGHLTCVEREQLHERLLDLNRELFDSLRF
ncbi:MAG: hypothetical protein KDN19_02435 [Verrucomicrobiae bacterium]|nr:hypothetical protein [Verrucomicrobiae bacterium]